MKDSKIIGVVVLCLASLSSVARAQDAFDLPMPSTAYVSDYASFQVAAANETSVKKSDQAASVASKPEFEPAIFSGSNAHQYMGLATIVGAVLTATSAPGEGCEANCPPPSQLPPRQTNGAHAKYAKATVALAAATIATGLWAHWDDFHLEDGFTDPDNLHVMLGVAGAALMAYATNLSAKSAVPVSHAGMAELGALGMVAAIKLTW